MQANSRTGVAAMLVVLASCGAIPSAVFAHGLLRSVGQAVIESDRVVVTLEVSPEDFTHLFGLQPSADGTVSIESLREAADSQAVKLAALLKIWDETGEPLVGEPFHWEFVGPTPSRVLWKQLRTMRIGYTASYRLPNAISLLTFRMSPEASSTAVACQWILEVRGFEKANSRTVQLTSRGNAETIELAWSDGRAHVRAASAAPHEERACATPAEQHGMRMREIVVEIEKTADTIDVRITVPLALLATWNPIHRRSEGRVEPDEQAALLAWARTGLGRVLEVLAPNREWLPETSKLRILGANSSLEDRRRPPRPVGYFVSQLEIRKRFAWTMPAEHVTLTWKLMNNAVYSARIAFHVGEFCTAGEFSSYAPTLEWDPDNADAPKGR